MLIRQIVLSVSVKAWALILVALTKAFDYFISPKRTTSKILHFCSSKKWTCFDFMRSGNSKAGENFDPVFLCPWTLSCPCSKSYRLANVLHCDGLGCVFGNHSGPLCEKVNHRIRVILIS